MKDLEGLLVITVEHAVAAPYASGKLADAGARVIKVERPEGDFARGYDSHAKGGSAYFVWLNRGKESVCLDLKADSDKANPGGHDRQGRRPDPESRPRRDGEAGLRSDQACGRSGRS